MATEYHTKSLQAVEKVYEEHQLQLATDTPLPGADRASKWKAFIQAPISPCMPKCPRLPGFKKK
jgi:hypothetical protein